MGQHFSSYVTFLPKAKEYSASRIGASGRRAVDKRARVEILASTSTSVRKYITLDDGGKISADDILMALQSQQKNFRNATGTSLNCHSICRSGQMR